MSRSSATEAATTATEFAGVIPDRARGIAAAVLETTKPRITRLVTITAAVGFVMAALAPGKVIDGWSMLVAALGCFVGTALAASGANALNQVMEQDRDAVMPRTKKRPLPRGAVSPLTVTRAATAMCVAGVAVLWLLCGPAPAIVCAATILSYLFLYTPLKPITPLSTVVGAVPGALPPLIGWTAASGSGIVSLAELGGWTLFALMFVWQVPHTLALAWMYREDYARGGYRVLPVIDPTGARTSAAILRWSVLLVPATMLPMAVMRIELGLVYSAVAGAMAVIFLARAVRLACTRTRDEARRTFIASIIHLPALMAALVIFAVLNKVM